MTFSISGLGGRARTRGCVSSTSRMSALPARAVCTPAIHTSGHSRDSRASSNSHPSDDEREEPATACDSQSRIGIRCSLQCLLENSWNSRSTVYYSYCTCIVKSMVSNKNAINKFTQTLCDLPDSGVVSACHTMRRPKALVSSTHTQPQRAANRIPIQIRRRQKRQVRGLILDSIRIINCWLAKS